MSCETVRQSLTAYAAGECGEAQRREIDAHLAGCEACAAELQETDEVWDALGGLPRETPKLRVRARFEAMLAQEEARRAHSPRRKGMHLLPIAASLILGLGVGYLAADHKSKQVDVAGLERQMGELREVVALTLLERGTVSERLQGVAYGRTASAQDDRVAGALFARLLDDPSVNVRLAAIEALRPLAAKPAGRGKLIDAVVQQKSPLVAISLIDVLLESEGAGVRKQLEELTDDPQLDPAIRGYLRDRLGRSA